MKDLTKEKKKAKEQAKDPNKPKKPLSSYLIFSMEMRKILDEEKPGMTFAEMNALIALKWKVGAGFFLNELISLLYIRIMDKNANFSSVG
jgi:hypothetical protein